MGRDVSIHTVFVISREQNFMLLWIVIFMYPMIGEMNS
jgi:hypothetical protein